MIKKVILSTFIVVFVFLVLGIINALIEKSEKNKKLSELPNINFSTIEGDNHLLYEVSKDKWVVFVFFGSGCHYCQEEANELSALLPKIGDIHFYWISDEPITTVKAFKESYKLNHPHVFFLFDENSKYRLDWEITVTPQFLIYSPEGKLIKNHKGALLMNDLINQIEDAIQTN